MDIIERSTRVEEDEEVPICTELNLLLGEMTQILVAGSILTALKETDVDAMRSKAKLDDLEEPSGTCKTINFRGPFREVEAEEAHGSFTVLLRHR